MSALVLGQSVTVTYAQKDLYDRVLGTVFKSDCSNVNLSQVASGATWYYEAYKCEIDSAYDLPMRRPRQAPRPRRWACGERLL